MNIRVSFRFLLVMLAVGIGIAVLPQTAAAQSDKENKEKRHPAEADDDDDDETLSAEDKKQVKLTLSEAREAALRRIAGKVIDEELEKENGRLQYAFDIRDEEGKLFDVEVDALTGEILQAVEEEDEDDPDEVAAKSKASKKTKLVEKTVRVARIKPN